MRTVGGLHAQIIDRENLTAAVWLAAKGRREQPVVQEYLSRFDEELERLRDELTTGELRCGECHTFTIHDPKERLITAPIFRERVLHHALMRICGPVLERRLMHHSYACRVGKGTFAALEAARRAAQGSSWFVKLDVRKYFASIDHERLMAALARVFREKRVLDCFRLLLAGYEKVDGALRAPCETLAEGHSFSAALMREQRPWRSERAIHRGLPIGTLVSQHLANFYLAALDTFILQELRPRAYVRYMDDLAVWVADAGTARAVRARILAFAREELALEMKTAFLNRTARGMDFLGHRVFPQRLGLNRASRRRYRQRIRSLDDSLRRGRLTEAEAQERAVALTAFTRHAACVRWRRRVLATLGEGPPAGNGCCAAGAGSTTAGTPDPRTATATSPRTATTTSASAPAPAPAGGRGARMEPALPPAPPHPAADETRNPRGWPVAPTCRPARSQGEPRGGGAFSQNSLVNFQRPHP